MRVVALEEHFTIPAVAGRISAELKAARGFKPRNVPAGQVSPLDLLPEFGDKRFGDMDKHGVTVQVLSISGPSADLVEGDEGVAIARDFNDGLAEEIKRRPDRLAGLAHLPLREPEASAKELERCINDLGFVGVIVNGTINNLFLDDPRFDPVLATAEALDVPIYVHPSLAPPAVRDVYFSNLPGSTGTGIETACWGWHSETAIHILRLVMSGTLDRHPKLKLIIGHMGEMLPMMMARIDDVGRPHISHLQRKISETILDQVWITTSGIFSQPPFIAALQTFGIDRIMFSGDYPYSNMEQGRRFLDDVALSPDDKIKLTHANADALLKLKS